MDDLSESYELGRGTGIAQAITAVYEVLERHTSEHEVYMALMEAIGAIQELRTKS